MQLIQRLLPLADRLRRRRLILIGAVLFFVGSVIMAIAPSVGILIVGLVGMFASLEPSVHTAGSRVSLHEWLTDEESCEM